MSDIIATVNGHPIRRFDYQNAIQGYSMENLRKTMDQLSAEELARIEELALEKLLARELIFQDAMAQGILAGSDLIEAERQKIIANFPSEEEFYATLEKAGIDAMAYHRMLRQDLTVNLMSDRKIGGLPDPSEAEIDEAFHRHRDKMKRSGRTRACHILIRIADGGREEALARIEELRSKAENEDFAQLARLHSACPSSTSGGDLGYFRRGDMVKSFEHAAFSQAIGVVGAPVETQFGFHLVKVLDREEDQYLTREEAAPQLLRLLKNEAGARVLAQWVSDLKAAADIQLQL